MFTLRPGCDLGCYVLALAFTPEISLLLCQFVTDGVSRRHVVIWQLNKAFISALNVLHKLRHLLVWLMFSPYTGSLSAHLAACFTD